MSISKLEIITPAELSGATIFYLPSESTQEVAVVTLRPYEELPEHMHTVDAEMFIVAGSGKVKSRNSDNGREVLPGDCVFFEKNQFHAFKAGANGLVFVSRNGGIRQKDGTLDLTLA